MHILSVVIWIGGMFFAYMALRPVAAKILNPPQRLSLWAETFSRFFPWVWLSVGFLLLSGFSMIHLLGGITKAGAHVLVMLVIGLLMMVIFGYVYFAPFKKLRMHMVSGNSDKAAEALAQIRKWIAVNLALGLFNIVVATSRYFV
jgi:uncharacterized membrane protein